MGGRSPEIYVIRVHEGGKLCEGLMCNMPPMSVR